MQLFGKKDPAKDNTSNTDNKISEDQKQANLAAGLNEDGSLKEKELSQAEKDQNLAKGLNEDGTVKEIPQTNADNTPMPESNSISVSFQPTELVIKEIMVQKNVSREEAIDILNANK